MHDSDERAGLCKAERLAIAGAVAPLLRRDADRLARRLVKVYRQEDGEVVRETTLLEATRGILRTKEIEFDVVPDPERCVICRKLGTYSSIQNSKTRGTRVYCKDHNGRQHKKARGRELCFVCGKPATAQSSRRARSRMQNAYCEAHLGTRASLKRPILPCVVCGKASTLRSSEAARRDGRGKAYCARHKGGPRALVEFEGRSQSISDWAAELGIRAQQVRWRLKNWPLERALKLDAQRSPEQRSEASRKGHCTRRSKTKADAQVPG